MARQLFEHTTSHERAVLVDYAQAKTLAWLGHIREWVWEPFDPRPRDGHDLLHNR